MTDEDTSGAALELAGELPEGQELPSQGGEEGGDAGLEKRLKDTQKKLHEVTQERSLERQELAERIARLEGVIQATQSQRTQEAQPEDPLAFLDDAELKEKFFEDASHPISAMKRVASEFAKVLPVRDEAILSRVQQMIAEQLGASRVDPDLRERIETLRKDPDLAKLDGKTLALFAKKLKPGKAKEYPGNIGGSRAGSGVGDFGKTEIEEEAKALMARIYGED